MAEWSLTASKDPSVVWHHSPVATDSQSTSPKVRATSTPLTLCGF